MRKLKLEELNRDSLEEFKGKKKVNLSIVLDNIRSAMNVGSFFRTADSFAVRQIFLTGISAVPPHPEINKTAIGATLSVDWEYEKDTHSLIAKLKKLGYYVIGIEQTSQSIALNQAAIPKDRQVVVVFGNEVDGIDERILPFLDECLEIPQYGTKHSLNVAVCGGIVIHQISNHLRE